MTSWPFSIVGAGLGLGEWWRVNVFWISVKNWLVLATICRWMKNKIIGTTKIKYHREERYEILWNTWHKMQDAYPGVFDEHESHTRKKLLSTTLHTPYLAEIWKILCLDPSLFLCQLYWCSSKRNNNKALRITFNSCKTVSTSSMALATVNIDKIIKVTSASSYV